MISAEEMNDEIIIDMNQVDKFLSYIDMRLRNNKDNLDKLVQVDLSKIPYVVFSRDVQIEAIRQLKDLYHFNVCVERNSYDSICTISWRKENPT
jgi:hypothetical protein